MDMSERHRQPPRRGAIASVRSSAQNGTEQQHRTTRAEADVAPVNTPIQIMKRATPANQPRVHSYSDSSGASDHDDSRNATTDARSSRLTDSRPPATNTHEQPNFKQLAVPLAAKSSATDTIPATVAAANPYVDNSKFSLPLINADFTWNADTMRTLSAVAGANADAGFLVIGCVGAQNTGKSTLLSMMTRNEPDDLFRYCAVCTDN